MAIAYIYIHFLCGIMAFGEMACLPGPLAVVFFPLWDFAGLFIYLFGFCPVWHSGVIRVEGCR